MKAFNELHMLSVTVFLDEKYWNKLLKIIRIHRWISIDSKALSIILHLNCHRGDHVALTVFLPKQNADDWLTEFSQKVNRFLSTLPYEKRKLKQGAYDIFKDYPRYCIRYGIHQFPLKVNWALNRQTLLDIAVHLSDTIWTVLSNEIIDPEMRYTLSCYLKLIFIKAVLVLKYNLPKYILELILTKYETHALPEFKDAKSQIKEIANDIFFTAVINENTWMSNWMQYCQSLCSHFSENLPVLFSNLNELIGEQLGESFSAKKITLHLLKESVVEALDI